MKESVFEKPADPNTLSYSLSFYSHASNNMYFNIDGDDATKEGPFCPGGLQLLA